MLNRNLLPWLLVVALLAAPASFAFAQGDGEGQGETKKKQKEDKPKEEKERKLGWYDIVANELNLEGDAREAYRAAAMAKLDAVKEWQKEHASEIKELKAKIKAARKDGSEDDRKALEKEMNELMQQVKAIEVKHDEKLGQLLTADQKKHIAGFQVYMKLMREFHRANLSDDQKAQIKEKTISKAMDSADTSEKAMKELYGEVAGWVKSDILTEDQVKQLESGDKCKKEKAEDKPKKEKTEGKGKGKDKDDAGDEEDMGE